MAAKQRAHTCCLNRAQLCRLVLRQRLPPAGGRRGDRPAHHFGPGLGLAGEWLGERACHGAKQGVNHSGMRVGCAIGWCGQHGGPGG